MNDARLPSHRLLRHFGHLVALTATVLAAAGLTYTILARGQGEQWNATEAESSAVLPGDALIADPSTPMTRAVTIDATPAQVWPWIAQFGQGRGGLRDRHGCRCRSGWPRWRSRGSHGTEPVERLIATRRMDLPATPAP